jgi:hypothetical protein
MLLSMNVYKQGRMSFTLLLVVSRSTCADQFNTLISSKQYNIEIEGRLRRKRYDNRDYFNYVIVNFPFLCSNISAAPVYGVYISQVIHGFSF